MACLIQIATAYVDGKPVNSSVCQSYVPDKGVAEQMIDLIKDQVSHKVGPDSVKFVHIILTGE